jgi:hypothetical protein
MSGRLTVSLLALALAGFAGSASAQTAPQGERARQPAATTTQPGTTTGQQQRRRERPAGAQARPNQPGQAARTNQPGQAARTNQPGQARGGGLNLDLGGGGNSGVPGATRRPGDSFAVSGPYATDAQMQRYTGRRGIQVPRAPIQMFQQDETDSTTGFRR